MQLSEEDRKLLQQLRDALVRSNNALNVLTATNHQHDAEIIAAADARLSQPEAALSHEVWEAICEQSSGWMNQSGKGLMIAENDLVTIGEQFAHPAAMPEPISSAPRDGTAILLGARCGWWIGKWKPVYTSGFKPDRAWFSLMLNHDHMTEKWEEPTHWMPLPKAMIAATKAGKE